MFRPLPDIEPKYDAVYNANLSAFERRHLAALIPSCIHIGYIADPSKRHDPVTEVARTRAKLPHHDFANAVDDFGSRRLSPNRVNKTLALARVGLCLSAAEGAMTSSMEDMLASLPIVSTPSLGGRDRYFHPETSLIVDPNPRAVRDAVAALVARNIPREYVREKALAMIAPQRRAFNDFIASLRPGKEPSGSDPRWSFDYVPNLHQSRPVADFLERMGLAG